MKEMITKELEEYIKAKILPIYYTFDGGHNIDHANKVINSSLVICMDYNVSINMVYTTAAYHDIGLKNGRKMHHLDSGKMVLEDLNLRKWFTEEEIQIISEAVIDHRASNDYEPRSIYGKIVAEADRDITYEMILKRTVLYSLEKYPGYTNEEHIKRVIEHITEKYGKNGYLNLWLKTKENIEGLKIIQEKLNYQEIIIQDIKKMLVDKNQS